MLLLFAYSILLIVFSIFWLRMLVDALKQHRPWGWIGFLAFVPVISGPLYFLNFYIFGKEGKGALDSSLEYSGRIRSLKQKIAENDLLADKRELADAYFESQNYNEALTLLQECLRGDGEDIRSQFQAGVSFLATGRPQLALPHLEYVLDVDPRFYYGEARLAYANALLESGDKERARDQFAWAATHFNIPEATVRMCQFLIQEGQKKEAYVLLVSMLQNVQLQSERLKRSQRAWIRKAADEIAQLKKQRSSL